MKYTSVLTAAFLAAAFVSTDPAFAASKTSCKTEECLSKAKAKKTKSVSKRLPWDIKDDERKSEDGFKSFSSSDWGDGPYIESGGTDDHRPMGVND
jgi:hypothetical protein